MGRRKGAKRLSIFVEGSFDYAHFLPENERCFPLHGHTSTAVLELTGEADKRGMLMDYSDMRGLLNEALSAVDHKLVVSEAYSRREGGTLVVEYRGFILRLPQEHAFIMKGEGTSENITSILAETIFARVPANVSAMRLTVSEGLRKGASVVLERRTPE